MNLTKHFHIDNSARLELALHALVSHEPSMGTAQERLHTAAGILQDATSHGTRSSHALAGACLLSAKGLRQQASAAPHANCALCQALK